jgi:type II secretory pathway component PulJ
MVGLSEGARLVLSEQQRQELLRVVRATSSAQRDVRRAGARQGSCRLYAVSCGKRQPYLTAVVVPNG